MKSRNHQAHLLAGIYVITGVLLLIGTDYLAGRSIENIRAVRLKKYSEAGMDAVVSEVASLEAEVELIEERVSLFVARTYPRLEDIKEISERFGLRFDRMERTSQSTSSPPGPRRYSTTVHGDARRLVHFLRELETTYVISCEQAVVYPVDEGGSVVGLSMSILIDETGT